MNTAAVEARRRILYKVARPGALRAGPVAVAVRGSGAERFDVVIVGCGPAGLAAGAQAATRGLKHLVLERGKLANTVHRYQKGKHVMDEPPALGLRPELPVPFAAGTRESVLEAWQRATKAAGTNIRTGPDNELVKIEGAAGDFTLHLKGGAQIGCARLVLAIGLQGNLRAFGVPGEELPHVTYQLDDPAEHVDKRILVVGTGDAGIENALALAGHNEVGLVNRRDEFPRAKPRNRALLEAAIKSGKIAHHTHAEVRRIEPGQVVLETPAGEQAVACDLIIGRLGAIPPRAFLEKIGVELASKEASAVPRISPAYEASIPGIYIVGALAGYPLIKHCLNQGYEVIEHILGHHVEPADEPLLAAKFSRLSGSVADILARIQARAPILSGITTVQLREFLADATVHVPAAGQVIYRRNDFSESFYTILEGSVEVVAPASDADLDTIYGKGAAAEERRIRLEAGQFFGEMSLVSGRRRSATVVAGDGCVLIEIPRLAMIKLMSSVEQVRRTIDEAFILRKLQTSLAPGVAVDELARLAASAVIERYRQGEVLFHEGDPSNGLHLIRRGSVTVSCRKAGAEQVLAYLPAGNIVGEMALFSPEGRRNATVKATIAAETIRIPTEAIRPFIDRHPQLRAELKSLEGERLIATATRSLDRRASGLVDFLVSAGAGEATDLLLVDEALCVRCDHCERACAETHGGVSRLDREAGPTYATVHVPTSCRHCEHPRCMTDCPPDALRRHPNGEVYIMDNCIGCGNCATNCPYGVIQLAAVEPVKPTSVLARLLFGWGAASDGTAAGEGPKVAVKCDLCRDLPARNGQKRAACVAACPTGAIARVNPKQYVDRLLASGEDG